MQSTSIRLKENIPQIMNIWEQRALDEIRAANFQERLALRDSLPEYLTQMVDALSKSIDRTSARKRKDLADSTRVGKKHGSERANSQEYTMDQMILEYHILREVVCDVMEEKELLSPVDREIIVCSIENAVNDAATQFSDTMGEFQEQLAHTLAHDMRNPLTTAKMSAQLLLKQMGDDDAHSTKTKLILKSIERIDKMIGEILDASRMKAGENAIKDFLDMDLNLLAHDLGDECNIAHSGRFVVQTKDKCVGCWNEDSLRRVLENLATNAVKYGKDKTPITITITEDSQLATISVHNEGEPIPLEEQSILFNKYRRARSAEHKAGWGLGLTVVKEIVEGHMGSVEVKSSSTEGTTFIIQIPKNRPEADGT